MTDRVILAVKYTPASGGQDVRRAVGGFLRYVQFRDKHPGSDSTSDSGADVKGLLKYVAFRDRAAPAGRLFGPNGPAGNQERRDFAAFVGRSVAATRPRREPPDRGDRRRAVYRFVISPEHAAGLDLGRLTRASVDRLEREAGVTGLRWIAAEHRNTAHPHVHLVLAGIREAEPGTYRGLLVTPRRLAAMKEELALEISRQRGASRSGAEVGRAASRLTTGSARQSTRPYRQPKERATFASHRWSTPRRSWPRTHHAAVFSRLQLAALRYRRRLEREAEEEARDRDREWSR